MAPQLDHLEAWVGEWETEATHPMLPDMVVPGRITVEWLEARSFSSTARAPITSTSPARSR
jgi:hypothetical protein